MSFALDFITNFATKILEKQKLNIKACSIKGVKDATAML
jgi:hypothetical protein